MCKIDQSKANLRDNRIKYGTDYSIVYKYGELRICCDEIRYDNIKEQVESVDLIVKEWFIYNRK